MSRAYAMLVGPVLKIAAITKSVTSCRVEPFNNESDATDRPNKTKLQRSNTRDPTRSSNQPTTGYNADMTGAASTRAPGMTARPHPNCLDTGSKNTANGYIKTGALETIMPSSAATAICQCLNGGLNLMHVP